MTRYIGAHVSASGGLEKAVERASVMGCNAVQVFTGSPRIWKSKSANDFDYQGFTTARKENGIIKAVIHATYLVNLASDNPLLVEKSRLALINDLNVAARGQFEGVVVHVGSHQGRGYEAVRNQVAEQIKRIIDESEQGGVFLIENSAGQKGKIGSPLEEIRDMIDTVGSDRLGWCVDTCHAHASGYLLGKVQKSNINNQNNNQTLDSRRQTQKPLFEEKVVVNRNIAEEIERLNLWASLKCVHVNDSRDAFDSGRDRHANLGEGNIPKEDLKEFLNHPKLTNLPLILEVPGFDDQGPDKKNVDLLRQIVA